MVILSRLASISTFFQLSKRFYAKKSVSRITANMIQVHQETLRYIDPCASIKVDSDIYLKVSTADPHKYPGGDAFIAELHGGPEKNCTASMEIKVSDDERNVEVILKKLTESTDFHCELAVPVKAALDINTRHAATVKNTYGEELKVRANKYIKTKNVRAEKIELCSEGDINCRGMLLGKETTMETQNKGDIILDKIQGDNLKCKTTQGNITCNSSYVESSLFQTDTGNMNLKNVHKTSAAYIYQKGDLIMTGVNGNLKVSINEGSLNLQLSELKGENIIDANKLTSCTINISSNVEESTSLDVSLIDEAETSTISLDSSLEHLSSGLDDKKQRLKWPVHQELPNKLKLLSKSSLTLGKSSWEDMTRLQMKNNKS